MRWEPGEACSPTFTALRVPAVRAQSLSRVRLFVTPWAEAHQAPVSMGFSRQEYWNGLPCTPPGDLPDPGIEPTSSVLQADSLPLSHQESPIYYSESPTNESLRCKISRR